MIASATARPVNPLARKGWFGATAHVAIPPIVYFPLMAMLVLFIGANTYSSFLATLMTGGKWVALGAVLLMAIGALGGRRAPQCPPILFFALALMFLFAITAPYLGLQPGYDMTPALPSLVVIGTGYVVAAVLVMTDSRRAFFDMVGIIGRILLIASTLFLLAGVNLGRGGGFAAWVDNPNTLAAILAPGMIVLFAGCIERRPGWKLYDLPFFLLGIPLIAETNGRASFVWVIFGMLVFWLYRRSSWPALLAFVTAVIVLLVWWQPIVTFVGHALQIDIAPTRTTKAGVLSGREEVWRIGWELFNKRPVFGYGMGSTKPLLAHEAWRFVRHQGEHFHSTYLEALVEMGLIGFCTFVFALVATVARGLRDGARTRALPRDSWPTAALPLAMVIGALGHAAFESWLLAAGNANAPLFWICVWLIHFQTQIPVRAVATQRALAERRLPNTALLTAR